LKLDPQIDWVLALTRKARVPPVWQLSPAEARRQSEKTAAVLDFRRTPVHDTRDLRIPTPTGARPARLVIPRAPAPGERLPLLVYFHGGGFVLGSLNSHQGLYTRLASAADCLVLAVDYRLAPEAPFPAAVEDALAALDFVFTETAMLGTDPTRILVGGDSAGGTLSAVCAIQARDRGLSLRHQLLIYPGTAPRPDSASHFEFAEGYLLERASVLWFYRHYLGATGCEDWRFAPLLAPSLSGVAPATLVLAGADPLRDEGLAYARRLRSAGVAVDCRCYPGMVHGFASMGGMITVARQAVAAMAASLRAACHS